MAAIARKFASVASRVVLAGVLAIGAILGLASAVSTAAVSGYTYDASTPAYGGAAHSVQAHTSEAPLVASDEVPDGVQGMAVTTTGSFSVFSRLSVAANTATRAGFVDGEIFSHAVTTGSGNLEMMAQARVSGSVLHLDDLMVFARTGTQLERVPMGTDAVVTLRNSVLAMAREQGFSRVEISYMRYFEGGAVRIPGQLAFDVG